MSNIRNLDLAPSGIDKINWVASYMPLLNEIKDRFIKDQPFIGHRISMSIHLEAKTAYLATVLKAGGATVHVTGCNQLSTQDDVCAGLAAQGVEVNAWHASTDEEYHQHLVATLEQKPTLIIDDGGDFVGILHEKRTELASHLIGGCEETTTGVARLRSRASDGLLKFPMLSVNDAFCKYLFDNQHGTGQSVWESIMHTTNLLIAGKTVVVAGYGFCGRGIASRAAGLGAKVIITEINPVRALEAIMEGFQVMSMDEAAPVGDIFVTATGCKNIIKKSHFKSMKDGVLLSNAGHFNVEVDEIALRELATQTKLRKPNIVGYTMTDGRVINLLAEGKLVNLASGNGHPAEIMDMSFAIQALCLEYLAKKSADKIPGEFLENQVYPVPSEIDTYVAQLKLSSLNISIDVLTEDQQKYLVSY